ncbi:hypothetical protein EKO04_008874 [Ascochyta lentis]|uniref:Carboxylic ester hydrolase n=1 Tax=Ascochyta lentis TaxID=205686 RepID=A0A8H7IXZ4_9PLEO|nr:hypothetical protein EKO04_008874 [Ascochyta lentis]
MALVLTALLGFAQLPIAQAVGSLMIETTSGTVQGAINSITPNVAHFLGVPFAEQPLGKRRWLPSIPKSKENGTIDASNFGPACAQFEGNAESVWLTDAPEFVITPRNYSGEDCLSVNLWAPWKEEGNCTEGTYAAEEEKLPVIAWIHGGSFQTGGATVPYQDPSRWVQRSGKHIVVGINYRLGIFGQPNAAGLADDEQNLGLLDQRLALEWIRDNIANFGGDPARITLWGQSAGAISVDNYNFAYPEDPIVSSLIMHSGTSFLSLTSVDPQHTNFTTVASSLGCGNRNATAEIDCLRAVPFSEIISFLKTRSDNGTTPGLTFNPIIDNRTRFSNYTARALARNFTRKPAIIGTTVDEGNVFLPYNRTYGPDLAIADTLTLSYFLCPSVQTTHNRFATNTTTFRYLYGGNFSNIAPQWWEGAYHQSDMPLVFGTHDIARTNSTPLEYSVSEAMQDFWLAFAQDPVVGLPQQGWEAYEPSGEAVLFGWEGKAVQPIKEADLEAPCSGLVPNGLPKPPTF